MTTQFLAFLTVSALLAGCQTTKGEGTPPSCLSETQAFFDGRKAGEKPELIAANGVMAAGFLDAEGKFSRGLFIMPAEMMQRQPSPGTSVSKVSDCSLPDGKAGKAILIIRQAPRT